MNTTFYDAITNAVLYLAGVCDYARSWDGQGFNKPDSHLGHDLARRAQHRTLTEEELHAAWALCWKYAGTQLAAAQIVLPTEEEARELFGATEPPILARTPGVIQFVDGELDVTFPYDPAKVACIRELRRMYGGSAFAERDGIKSWDYTRLCWTSLYAVFPRLSAGSIAQQCANRLHSSLQQRLLRLEICPRPTQRNHCSRVQSACMGSTYELSFPTILHSSNRSSDYASTMVGRVFSTTLVENTGCSLRQQPRHCMRPSHTSRGRKEAQSVLQRSRQQQQVYQQRSQHIC